MQVGLTISVNGEPRRVAEGARLSDLLRELGLAGAAVAVERNRRLVRAQDHASTELSAGDELEIVTLVGGG